MSSSVQVVVIGVTGCSASGKSTVSSLLAAFLHSPLYPIDMDRFFDPVMCETLGTWEDPRCLRTDAYAAFVESIRDRLKSGAASSECLADLDGADAFLRTAAPTETACVDSDDSLHAHTAEDTRRRALHTPNDTPNVPDSVRFVVCEGFCLLASAAVVRVLDVFVTVQTEAETACLRRFLRAPRRHAAGRGVEGRIAKMRWARRGMAAPLPPSPSVDGDYEGFWRRAEYADAEGEKWMTEMDLPRITQTLQAHAAGTAELDALRRRYFEMRYWFYYEVLYYHHRLRAEMMRRMHTAAAAMAASGFQVIWRIENGADVSSTTLEERVRFCADSLIKERCPSVEGV